jgi:hypothetical protein
MAESPKAKLKALLTEYLVAEKMIDEARKMQMTVEENLSKLSHKLSGKYRIEGAVIEVEIEDNPEFNSSVYIEDMDNEIEDL